MHVPRLRWARRRRRNRSSPRRALSRLRRGRKPRCRLPLPPSQRPPSSRYHGLRYQTIAVEQLQSQEWRHALRAPNVSAQEPQPPEVVVVDPDAEAMYWRSPAALLSLFSQMEERNLFLVQHLQVPQITSLQVFANVCDLCLFGGNGL